MMTVGYIILAMVSFLIILNLTVLWSLKCISVYGKIRRYLYPTYEMKQSYLERPTQTKKQKFTSKQVVDHMKLVDQHSKTKF